LRLAGEIKDYSSITGVNLLRTEAFALVMKDIVEIHTANRKGRSPMNSILWTSEPRRRIRRTYTFAAKF